MKYISKEQQKYIQQIFKQNNYKFYKNIINSSTLKKICKQYPNIKIILENILKNQPKFQKLTFVLKCILLNIDLPLCKICQNELNYKQIIYHKQYCSKKCLQNDPQFKESLKIKRQNTCLQKYGVPYSISTTRRQLTKKEKQIALKKRQKTCLNKYGVDSNFKTEEFKIKSKQTCLQKYQTEYANQSEIIKNKIKITRQKFTQNKKQEILNKCIKTNQLKFGTNFYAQNPSVKYQENLKLRAKQKLWNTILSFNEFIIPLFTINDLDTLRSKKIYKWKCCKCGYEFESYLYKTNFHKQFTYLPRCVKCFPKSLPYSSQEKELADFCKIYFPNLETNKRKYIYPYELDIVIPEIKLAIEFNGNYWHSKKPKNYHQMKTDMCKNIGFQLIHIWENDWKNNKIQIKQNLIKIFLHKSINNNDFKK